MHEMVNKSFVFTFVVLLDPHVDQLVHWKIDWSSTFSSCKTNQFISRLMPPLYKKPIGANAGFQLQLSELTYTCLKPHYTSLQLQTLAEISAVHDTVCVSSGTERDRPIQERGRANIASDRVCLRSSNFIQSYSTYRLWGVT